MKFNFHAIAFEDKLVRIALFIGLLPCFIVFCLLFYVEFSIYLKILLLLFLLGIVLYFAFYIRQKVISQLLTSTNLMEAMVVGDFSMRAIQQDTEGVLNEFNQLLNSVISTLAEHRLVSKENQILLHKVIDQIDVAIIALDANDAITLMNPAAENLFKCRFESVKGWPVKTLGLQDLMSHDVRQVFECEIAQYKKKVFIHIDEFFEKGEKHKLIFITDIQHLLREEERRAWQKLLRVLSHEINNSLTPIASISESLLKMLANSPEIPELGEDLQEGLSVINERSDSLNQFICRYQQLAKLPQPVKKLFNLEVLIHNIALLYPETDIQTSGVLTNVYADENQLKQVIVNLVKNAIEAMNAKGTIDIQWEKSNENIEIHILDQGSGINNTDNLFIPFYTTKEHGSGIGIVLSRQILMNHGGDLAITNRLDGSGAKATIYLPVHNK